MRNRSLLWWGSMALMLALVGAMMNRIVSQKPSIEILLLASIFAAASLFFWFRGALKHARRSK